MVEELRFFLRTAIFALVISAIYWFVSYEIAGTVLLIGIIIATGFFVVAATLSLEPKSRQDFSPKRESRSGFGRMAGVFDRYLRFEEEHATGGEPTEAPLALEEGRWPQSSAWPLLAGLAALLAGLGVIYGPWLWIPGLALGVSTLWGWAGQLTT